MVMLVVALLATVGYVVVLGIRQWLRARTLARLAGERTLRFSRDDAWNLPEQFCDFALMRCGHSARASHISHGRLHGQNIRAFNFRYEVGHGTRRMTRHYGVVVAEMAAPMPETLMWNRHDAEHAPADMHQADREVGCWACTGNGVLADIVRDGALSLAEEGLSVQAQGKHVMFALPGWQGEWWNYTMWLDQVAALLDQMNSVARDA